MSSPSRRPGVLEAPILHVDLDAFFASVEVLDDPSLAGRPVAVGGAGERGVIASASYEARRFGVRSAMSTAMARRLCPTLVVVPGRFERYGEYSQRFHEIVADLTPVYEPLGLDEVFADLRSLARRGVDPLGAAVALRRRLLADLSLRCGIGVARNKLFAKLASKAAKPRIEAGRLVEGEGVVWVDGPTEERWLATLPVRALWGVGPATAAKLERLGLRYVRDLRGVSAATLARSVGPSMAATLVGFAAGEDDREVVTDRPLKSLGHEETFARSLVGREELSAALRVQAGVVARTLRERDLVARTLTVLARFDDGTQVSRSQTVGYGLDDEGALLELADALAGSIELVGALRLLGLHASGLRARTDEGVQLRLALGPTTPEDAPEDRARARQAERAALRDAIDEVRRRFGRDALATAGELGAEGVEVATQRGRHPFGPDDPRTPR
ncbi:MAG TPA: DNA polymerase IV [Acidimicrobiales bacterium]|nr:DNA polymerase IV [Acidimicrobiales bacterium]